MSASRKPIQSNSIEWAHGFTRVSIKNTCSIFFAGSETLKASKKVSRAGNWYDLCPRRLYGSFGETAKTLRTAASHLLKDAVKVPKTHTCCNSGSVFKNPVIIEELVAFLKLLFAFWNAALVVRHVLSFQTIPRSFVVSYRTQFLTRLELTCSSACFEWDSCSNKT